MKRVLFLFLIIFISFRGFSQAEFSTNFKVIPPKYNAPKTKKETPQSLDIPPINTPNITKKPDVLKPDPPVQILTSVLEIPKSEFINPGDAYRDKLNKKADNQDGVFYRKNQNLGNFKTNASSAKVSYRDAAYVDGDQIRVYLNDRVIQNQVYLDSNFKGFEIVLEKGFNKIEFEALNQGTSGPNTAEFQVYDDKGTLISASQWNLGTGFRATIILTKE